jgi:4-amino-4-deoxy-L-arabinose transferase-like glycosyltransferase
LIQIKALDKRESPYHLGAGVLLGVSVLFRPMIFFLLPLPYIYKIVTSENREERACFIRNFVFFAISCCVVLVPWWVRNLITLERFVFLTDFGHLFYYGIVRDFSLLPVSDAPIADGVRLFLLEFSSRPLETFSWFTLGKLYILLVHPSFFLPFGFTFLSSMAMPMHMYIVTLGSIGLLGGLMSERLRPMSLFVIFYIMLSLFFIPTPRYGLQYVPFLAIFSVYTLFQVFKKRQNFENACL